MDRQLSLWRWWLISFTLRCARQKKTFFTAPSPPPHPPHTRLRRQQRRPSAAAGGRGRGGGRGGRAQMRRRGAKLSNHMVQARHRCEGSGGHPLSHAESAALTESCCAVRGRCGLCSPHRLRRRPHRRRRPLWTSATATGSAAGLRSFIWPALACNQ